MSDTPTPPALSSLAELINAMPSLGPTLPGLNAPGRPVVTPCPVCGHELAPRSILLRDWLLHPFASLRRRRYDREYPAWHFLINHGRSTVLHSLSPSIGASWSSLLPPEAP